MRMMQMAFFLLFTPAMVSAGTMEITWTPPTAYENGRPLFLHEIDRYEIRYVGLNKGPRGNKYVKPTSVILIEGKPVTRSVVSTSITTSAGIYNVAIRTRLLRKDANGNFIRSEWSEVKTVEVK